MLINIVNIEYISACPDPDGASDADRCFSFLEASVRDAIDGSSIQWRCFLGPKIWLPKEPQKISASGAKKFCA
jgi:hypothetical protein